MTVLNANKKRNKDPARAPRFYNGLINGRNTIKVEAAGFCCCCCCPSVALRSMVAHVDNLAMIMLRRCPYGCRSLD